MALIFISAIVIADTQTIAGPVGRSKYKLIPMPMTLEKQLINIAETIILDGVLERYLAAAAGIIVRAGANNAPNIFITIPIIIAYEKSTIRRIVFDGNPCT